MLLQLPPRGDLLGAKVALQRGFHHPDTGENWVRLISFCDKNWVEHFHFLSLAIKLFFSVLSMEVKSVNKEPVEVLLAKFKTIRISRLTHAQMKSATQNSGKIICLSAVQLTEFHFKRVKSG